MIQCIWLRDFKSHAFFPLSCLWWLQKLYFSSSGFNSSAHVHGTCTQKNSSQLSISILKPPKLQSWHSVKTQIKMPQNVCFFCSFVIGIYIVKIEQHYYMEIILRWKCVQKGVKSIKKNLICITPYSRLRAKKGPAPPPREFCRHILSWSKFQAASFKRCLHSVLWGVSLWQPVTYVTVTN